MSIEKDGFVVIRNAISEDVRTYIKLQQEMQYKIYCIVNRLPYGTKKGDGQVENSFSRSGSFWSESLLELLQPLVEEHSESKLYPTYSYSRIYFKGAEMLTHIDRVSCEISCTLCIENYGAPWPIWFTSRNGKDVSIALNPGDCIIYYGVELEHWRLPYTEGEKVMQVFLHYVKQDGKYSEWKFDKRSSLGLTL